MLRFCGVYAEHIRPPDTVDFAHGPIVPLQSAQRPKICVGDGVGVRVGILVESVGPFVGAKLGDLEGSLVVVGVHVGDVDGLYVGASVEAHTLMKREVSVAPPLFAASIV